MTSTVHRFGPGHPTPGLLKEIVISCDHMSCNHALSDKEIQDQGGLKNIGWSIVPIDGTVRHYCPKHPRDTRDQKE